MDILVDIVESLIADRIELPALDGGFPLLILIGVKGTDIPGSADAKGNRGDQVVTGRDDLPGRVVRIESRLPLHGEFRSARRT